MDKVVLSLGGGFKKSIFENTKKIFSKNFKIAIPIFFLKKILIFNKIVKIIKIVKKFIIYEKFFLKILKLPIPIFFLKNTYI